MKEVIIIGGPNGAGKTTAAADLLPKTFQIREFVNADEIARGLSPFNPEDTAVAAARLMIERIHTLIDSGASFGFETTCAGRGHLHTIERCQAAGYSVFLLFLWLPSVEMALKRVARRVRSGGHNIPPDVIRRRYVAGLRNMYRHYLPLVDIGLVYDNSDHVRRLIVRYERGQKPSIRDAKRWKMIEEVAR